jgi:hypothetical protein
LSLPKWASFYRIAERYGAQESTLISDVFFLSLSPPKAGSGVEAIDRTEPGFYTS